jgi:hypothetical protein
MKANVTSVTWTRLCHAHGVVLRGDAVTSCAASQAVIDHAIWSKMVAAWHRSTALIRLQGLRLRRRPPAGEIWLNAKQ